MNPNFIPEAMRRALGGVQLMPDTLNSNFIADIEFSTDEDDLKRYVEHREWRMYMIAMAVAGNVPFDIAEEQLWDCPLPFAHQVMTQLVTDWQTLRLKGVLMRCREGMDERRLD